MKNPGDQYFKTYGDLAREIVSRIGIDPMAPNLAFNKACDETLSLLIAFKEYEQSEPR